MKLTTFFAVATAGLCTTINAKTERDLDSHEHGAAALNLALDEASVFIELDTPWNNIIGFEHAPKTSEQKALVNDALALLQEPGQLFSFAGSDCVLDETVLENNLAVSEHTEHDEHADGHDEHADGHDEHADGHDEHADGHDEHADGHDEHADEHDEHADGHDEHADGHDEHADGHDEHVNEQEGTHSSVLVSYVFNCKDLDKLVAIDLDLFKIWTGFDEIDVQLIGPGGQAGMAANAQQIRLDLGSIK